MVNVQPATAPTPRRIAILAHLDIPGSLAEAQLIADFLRAQGDVTVAWGSFQDPAMMQRFENEPYDLLIALGGDGTMLRAANMAAPRGLAVLGINLGQIGFLTEIPRGDWREILPNLFTGEYRLEERMLLRAEHWRAGQKLGSWHVINEVVVCRGQFVRPIRVEVLVDGYLMTRYVADGVIASTPTGSTAYALAAGGPILPPELRNILIIPVAPHLSMDRAIILSEGSGVTITVHSSQEAVLSVDGRPSVATLEGDQVQVTANDFSVKFLRFQDPGYFYRNITAYMEQSPLTGNRNA